MRLHKIPDSEAHAVIVSPDETCPGDDGKPNAFKTVGGRRLKAVYVVEGKQVILLTIYPTD